MDCLIASLPSIHCVHHILNWCQHTWYGLAFRMFFLGDVLWNGPLVLRPLRWQRWPGMQPPFHPCFEKARAEKSLGSSSIWKNCHRASCLFKHWSFASWPHGITVYLTFTIIPLLVVSRLPVAWFADGMLFNELYTFIVTVLMDLFNHRRHLPC